MARSNATRRPQGIALVAVLMIVALISILAYHLVSQHLLMVSFARQSLEVVQVRQLARGGEALARQFLFEDWEDEARREIDALNDVWAGKIETLSSDNGTIELRISDATARLNVNTIINEPEHLARLQRVLDYHEIDRAVADRWLDFIDEDLETKGFGAEDGDYLLREPPFRVSNQPVTSVEELLAIVELTEEEKSALRTSLAALPADVITINVNTVMDEAVVSALGAGVTRADIDQLLESDREFESVEEVTGPFAVFAGNPDYLATTTQYFVVEVRARQGEYRADLRSVVFRDPATGHLKVIARDFGGRVDFEDQQARPS